MALSYKARRRWALVVLLLALPVYIVVSLNVIQWFDRPTFWVELAVYVGLGVLWVFPLKAVFKGVGQADPDTRE